MTTAARFTTSHDPDGVISYSGLGLPRVLTQSAPDSRVLSPATQCQAAFGGRIQPVYSWSEGTGLSAQKREDTVMVLVLVLSVHIAGIPGQCWSWDACRASENLARVWSWRELGGSFSAGAHADKQLATYPLCLALRTCSGAGYFLSSITLVAPGPRSFSPVISLPNLFSSRLRGISSAQVDESVLLL